MTVEKIDIVIREDGARVVDRNIDNIGNTAKKTNSSISSLKAAIAGLVTGALANFLKNLTSQWTDLNSRIKIATGSQEQANAVMARLQEIAKRTYAELSSVSEIYLRNAASLTQLGFSTKQQIDFTEAMTNALVVSGAKQERATSVINALSKGLAGGALRGEDLNTVLEQGGRVAEALAAGLGVGVNELKALGAEGKLTSSVVLPAMLSQFETLREEADSMPATINDAFTNLNTQLMVSIGTFDEALGASAGVTEQIDALREMLVQITPELINVARALTGQLDPLDEMSEGAKILATSLVILETGFKVLAKTVTTVLTTAFNVAGNNIAAVIVAIQQAMSGDFLGAAQTLKDGFSNASDEIKTNFKELANYTIQTAEDSNKRLNQIWAEGQRDRQPRTEATVVSDAQGVAPVSSLSEAELKKQQNELNKYKSALQSVLSEIAPLEAASLKYAKSQEVINNASKAGLITLEQSAEYLKILEAQYQATSDPLGALNRELSETESLMLMTSKARETEIQLMSIQQDLLRQGVVLNDAEIADLRDRLQYMNDLNIAIEAQDRLLADSVGNRQAFQSEAEAIQALMANPQTGFTEGDGALSTSNLISQMGLDPDVVQTGIDARIAQFKQMYSQIDELRNANLINDQTAEALRAQVAIKAQQQQLQYANSFFGNLAALSQSGNKKVAAIGRAAAITTATIDGVVAVQKALASAPPPVNYALAAATGVAAAANVAKISGLGFETGGGFTVGGSGGADSQLVAFRASPRERVSVSTPSQVYKGDPARKEGGSGSNVSIPIAIAVVGGEQAARDFINSEEGQSVIIDVSRKNPEVYRGILNNA